MLALETSQAWTAISLQATIGGITHTFAPTTERDAKTLMDSLATWVAAQWAGKSLSWSWSRDPLTGGAILSMHCSHTVALVPNATATSLLGFTTITAQDLTASTAAAGTWAPTVRISVQRDLRRLEAGDGCGNGAIRPGVPALAGREPKVEAVGTALDAARLAGLLSVASNPRRAQILQVHTGLWVEVALGQVSRSPEGAGYRFGLEAVGDTP